MYEKTMTHSEVGMAISNRPGGMSTVDHPSEYMNPGQAHVPDAIDSTISSLQHAIERINSIEYRLRRIADRYVGSRPSPVEVNKATTASNPTIQQLLGDLGGSVERLFTELNRINEQGN